MVKNRNWQNRIERTDARRKDAKQRKQRTTDLRQYKVWVKELFQLLNRHGYRPLHLHVWTDSIASDSPPLLDILDDANEGGAGGGKSKKGRGRSSSIENEIDPGAALTSSSRKGGGRGRSGSFSDAGGKGERKNHPRSKEQASAPTEQDDRQDAPLLCRSHFFRGKCDDASRKKGACRYLHYSSRYLTLATAVNLKRGSESLKREVNFTEDAAISAVPEGVSRTDPGAVDMLYYINVDLKAVAVGENKEDQSASDYLVEALSTRNIKLSSIVYVAINNTLIFDRYREGVLVNDRDFLFAMAGAESGMGERRVSMESEESAMALKELPGPILEHVLTFLPDAAVAAASQVCKAWSHEIGQNSPNLWRHLLLRREWPLPGSANSDNSEEGEEEDEGAVGQLLFRQSFLQHYTAMRDANAIKSGINVLVTNRVAGGREMCYQDFSTREHAPTEPNCCVALATWAPRRALAAYSRDCSLRLFESTSRNGAEDILCRELVSVRVDPYKNTKRRRCSLVSMGLDEQSIGCLCHVMADNVEAEAYILVVLSRDDFLLGDSGSTAADVNLNVIDIGESVLNYVLSSDVVDHRMLQLMDFLSEDGEIGEVEVLVSQTIAACGYGRFMVEVSISIPSNEADPTMRLLDRKLVLFSANAGAIVWMGESNDLSRPIRPRREDITLSSLRRPPQPGGSRVACSIVLASVSTPAILVSSIDPSGIVENPQLVEASDFVRNEIHEAGWEIRNPCHQRPIIVTETDIVAGKKDGGPEPVFGF